MPKSNFFLPFRKPSQTEWLELLGDNAHRQFRISDSIHVPVFIHEENAIVAPPLAGKKENQWNITGYIPTSNASKANQLALDMLRGGVDEIVFVLRKPNIEALLHDIQLPLIETSFAWHNESTPKAMAWMKQLHAYCQQKNWDSQTLKGSFQLRPFTQSGRLRPGLQAYLQNGDRLFPNFKLLAIHQDDTLEIELAFAKILRQVQKLFSASKDKALIINKLQIHLIAGTNIITTIANIRAFKRLWLHWLQKQNLPLALPDIAVTLDTTHWTNDVNQNRILATSQAMSAAIAGIQHLIIPTIEPDTFSERISRNIQHIMKMEAHLDRVVDPAAGSKIIEALTERIAIAAFEQLSV